MPSSIIAPLDCDCSNSCVNPYYAGAQGAPGIGSEGAAGSDGVNAYSTTSLSFVMPDADSTVQLTVDQTAWMVVGQTIFVQSAGFFSVTSVDSDTTVTITNPGVSENTASGTTINGSRKVAPAGPQGETGPVSSVALSLPTEFSVSGSPVTSSGTLTGAWATQNANVFLSGPSSGTATTPSFRAMVATDIPGMDAAKITSGTFSISRGGTGQSTASAAFNALSFLTTKGDLLVTDGTTNARLPVGSAGQVLTVDSSQTYGVKWATGQTAIAYGVVSATYTSGTDGGSATAASWVTRPLTSVDGYSGLTTFSLSSNVLTLDTGTYLVEAWASGNSVGAHQMRIYRSDGTSFLGSTELAPSGTQTKSVFSGAIVVGSSQTLTMQHYFSAAKLLNGMGSSAGFGTSEVYAKLSLTKIA